MGTLNLVLTESSAWAITTWGGNRHVLDSVQGMCRAVFSRGVQKTSCMDETPLLFARLGLEKGVGPRAIAQYDSAPREKHNKVSIELCADEEGSFRVDILAMPDDFAMCPRLKLRNEATPKLHSLDKVAEGPHATFKSESERARGSNFPWVAAPVRVDQHLQDIRELCDIVDVSVQHVWDHYKRVLSSDEHHMRNVRLSREEFANRVC